MNTSYLDVPRIHFKGKYRADVNTRNNCHCNFDPNNKIDDGQEWNYKGTSEWEFIDTYITSVIDKKGKEVTESPLIGAQVFSHDEGPLAKLVDLDVDVQFTSLYGVEFVIKVDGETVLKGDWQPAVIVRDMWTRVMCDKPNHRSGGFGTISTSIITNIECPSKISKNINLCKEWKAKELSVSISLSYYSADVFTIGEMVGTIGIAEEGEPLNVGGERKLESTGQPLKVCPHEDPVNNGVNVAPFAFDSKRKKLVLDISNAFPTDTSKRGIDLGTLWLGVLEDGAVTTFGEPLPYLEPHIWEQGGVIEYDVSKELKKMVKNSPIVIVKEIEGDLSGDHIYPHKETFPSLQSQDSKVMVLLKESEYFVRPMGHYHDRLEYGNSDYESRQMTFLVTSFGEPVKNAVVKVDPLTSIPADGVIALYSDQKTDRDGLVTYTFQANEPIPFPRVYKENPCISSNCPERLANETNSDQPTDTDTLYKLPIDGQVYHFCYFVEVEGEPVSSCDEMFPKVILSQVVTFLSFTSVFYERPYTWLDHVYPIFKQVHHLHHIMSAALDMSSYKDVTQPYNKILLKQAMSKDINDAGYMPVTRDLSPTKKRMILEWLERPCFSKIDCMTLIDRCEKPYTQSRLMTEDEYDRCSIPRILRKSHPQKYFEEIYKDAEHSTFALRAKNPPRPLFGYSNEEELEEAEVDYTPKCNVKNLKGQLQLAMQIEYSTLPLYLTSLYTIMGNCNVEAYQLVRNIIVQEMLHFAQAANILIAIGGKVKIDSRDTVPHFPARGLPGGVLPNLTLTLEKFTLKHVHDNFMALEVPAYSEVPKPQEHINTIGQFYEEIQNCMLELGDKIFKKPREEKQVEWPWDTPADVGNLYKVTDLESALRAIEQIVEQGEGARVDNPMDETTKQHAHFFRFEEIFCENKLEKLPGGEEYAYSGDPIPYNPNGVWNMKNNLAISDIEKGTVCYTQAKAFHAIYRTFLQVLQDTYDGHPERIGKTVKLMQMLKIHAKRAIWTPLKSYATRPPEDGELMCGPIWDYEWEE